MVTQALEGWSRIELAVLHRLLTDPGALAYAMPVLSGIKWGTPGAQWIWDKIESSFDDTGEAPSIDVLRAGTPDAPTKDGLREDLKTCLPLLVSVQPTPAIRADARQLRQRAIKLGAMVAIQQAVDRFDRGRDDQAIAALRRGLEHGEAVPAPAAKPLIPRVLKVPKNAGRIPTGLWRLDYHIDGLAVPEVGLIIGVSGAGKSSVCITFAHAGIGEQRRVLYIDTENGEQVVLNRFITRFTGIPFRTLENRTLAPDQQARLDTWMERNYERLAERLHVLYIGYLEKTVAELSSSIDRTIRGGFRPDMIVFDSPDHLIKPGGDVRWEQHAELSQHMKALAQRFGLRLWATSQAGAQWEGRVAPPKAVADAYQKARDASIVLSINAIPREGALLDRFGIPLSPDDIELLMYVGKDRNRQARMLIELECDLSRMYLKAPPIPFHVRMAKAVGDGRDIQQDAAQLAAGRT